MHHSFAAYCLEQIKFWERCLKILLRIWNTAIAFTTKLLFSATVLTSCSCLRVKSHFLMQESLAAVKSESPWMAKASSPSWWDGSKWCVAVMLPWAPSTTSNICQHKKVKALEIHHKSQITCLSESKNMFLDRHFASRCTWGHINNLNYRLRSSVHKWAATACVIVHEPWPKGENYHMEISMCTHRDSYVSSQRVC